MGRVIKELKWEKARQRKKEFCSKEGKEKKEGTMHGLEGEMPIPLSSRIFFRVARGSLGHNADNFNRGRGDKHRKRDMVTIRKF